MNITPPKIQERSMKYKYACCYDCINFSVSKKIIIGTSITAGLLIAGILFVLIVTGSVKVGRHLKKFVRVTQPRYIRCKIDYPNLATLAIVIMLSITNVMQS